MRVSCSWPLARRSFLSKYAFITSRTIGRRGRRARRFRTAPPPTISGCFLGSKGDKPGVVSQASVPVSRPSATGCDASCAVPVFPQTLMFGSARHRPVPPSFTTAYMPEITCCTFSGLNCAWRIRTGFRALHQVRLDPLAAERQMPPIARGKFAAAKRDGALSDRDRDRLAGVPLLPEDCASSIAWKASCLRVSFGRSIPVFVPSPAISA